MKSLISIIALVSLSACSTVSGSDASGLSAAQYDKIRATAETDGKSAALRTSEDEVCQRIYENYNVVMAANQPKKKSFAKRLGGGVLSAVGGAAVSGVGLAAGGIAARATDTVIDAATYDPAKGLGQLQSATSIIEINRVALRQANEYNCPLKPIMSQ